MAVKMIEMDLELQNTISGPPMSSTQLYQNACSNDTITIQSWEKIWLANIKANKEKYGNFSDHSIGKFFGEYDKRPVIIAGSGPSLKENIKDMKDTQGIPILSCLHNYHYFEDNEVKPFAYVSLDAGDITVEEISEGGSKTPEEYLESTKDKKLFCFIGTSPKLLNSWRGEVYFFNAPVPSAPYMAEVEKMEKFNTYVSNGGNVLGACMYIAKGFMGANPIIFTGADFCFSYTKKFHAWDSKYDKSLGYVMKAVDIFGNKRLTWQSYYNFKCWFDWVSCNINGLYINSSEGGCLGSYSEGNIEQIKQMPLNQVVRQYSFYRELEDQAKNPKTDVKKLLF